MCSNKRMKDPVLNSSANFYFLEFVLQEKLFYKLESVAPGLVSVRESSLEMVKIGVLFG